MPPLTKAEVDSLLAELGPQVNTEADKIALGVQAYRKFLTAYPQYIALFSRLQGLDINNVFQSDGIKYYGRTFVDDIVKFVQAAADDAQFKKALEDNGKAHTTRNVTKDQFMSGEPIFIDFFKSALKKPENQAAVEKLLKAIFPTVASYL
ncbi:unnamed protein product [Dicrocoelium dendriticum]|nr:unnamed protein product [Dicrocoelium dendriticum]